MPFKDIESALSGPVHFCPAIKAADQSRFSGTLCARALYALVRDVLGLTLGEARLATLFGVGLAPKSAAEKLGTTENTARAVLKNVFAKTGVSRQSELVALLRRLILR